MYIPPFKCSKSKIDYLRPCFDAHIPNKMTHKFWGRGLAGLVAFKNTTINLDTEKAMIESAKDLVEKFWQIQVTKK